MKKILASILAFVSTLSLSACGEQVNGPTPQESTPTSHTSEPTSQTSEPTSQTSEPTSQTSEPTSQASEPTSQASEPTSQAGEPVTIQQTALSPIEITDDNVLNSVRVFDTMYGNNKQAMFSPLSLNLCLGMVEAGAGGSSKAALDAYLANTDYAKFAKDYLEHAKGFNREADSPFVKYKEVFEIANSLWASNSIPLSEDFKKSVSKNYSAEISNIDFGNNSAAAKAINDWVNGKTHEMIPSIVSENQLNNYTAAVLVNTVYFESAWAEEWKLPSEKEKFTNADGSTTETELMRNSGDSYYENDKATAFSCYYKNGMKFIGILPKAEGDFTLESLDINSLLESETYMFDVFARMPKLNFESEFPLNDALKAAGLSDIFDPATADFTPMQGGGGDDILLFYVTDILQKTKLELDEQGTRAAAATAAIIGNEAEPMPLETKEVFLNRPFAFLIYDGEADQIVFMGKVTEM